MNTSTKDPSLLLNQLEGILESGSHFNEVGFIHPALFPAFSEEVHSAPSSSSGADGSRLEDETNKKSEPALDNSSDTYFWRNEHKLGISTLILVPLYRAAKDAFMDSYKRYRMLSNSQFKTVEGQNDSASICSTSLLDNAEIEVMRHSRALLLLSCDFGTAWNSRKLILSKRMLLPMFMDELLLSALVLSYSPKSERAWSHRRWVIKLIAGKCATLPEIVRRESELVKKIVENSKMNYRAWNHQCWLVSYMTEAQILSDLQNYRDWAALHVADNSCFHYRARMLVQMIENSWCYKDPESIAEFHRMWKEELDWDAMLIRQYVGRESLWLHRRFLSLLWMKHLASDDQSISSHSCCTSSEICDLGTFVKDEITLSRSCTIIPDNEFGDYHAQANLSATYISWLAKQMPMYFAVLQESSHSEILKLLLEEAGKSCLWDSVNASRETMPLIG